MYVPFTHMPFVHIIAIQPFYAHLCLFLLIPVFCKLGAFVVQLLADFDQLLVGSVQLPVGSVQLPVGSVQLPVGSDQLPVGSDQLLLIHLE
ncbi:hypothetical protein L6452_35795 [Arctium lappa]|uniref:Uncharacterized protein n=1 Tax=Arctium lappa TaxID=4217 RepID=A0ACB8Y817_ARCLA|nr:hypothetical protein L6452_35795 [Arctium lappa]